LGVMPEQEEENPQEKPEKVMVNGLREAEKCECPTFHR
jgi:hypothetical protein